MRFDQTFLPSSLVYSSAIFETDIPLALSDWIRRTSSAVIARAMPSGADGGAAGTTAGIGTAGTTATGAGTAGPANDTPPGPPTCFAKKSSTTCGSMPGLYSGCVHAAKLSANNSRSFVAPYLLTVRDQKPLGAAWN